MINRYIFQLSTILVLFMCVFASPKWSARAEIAPYDKRIKEYNLQWDSVLNELSRAEEKLACGSYWKILWPIAKNPVNPFRFLARQKLLTYMLSPEGKYISYPPGYDGDQGEYERHIKILAAYSNPEKNTDFYKMVLPIIRQFMSFSPEDEYYEGCFHSSQKICTELLVKFKQIPSFEAYSNDIDMAISKGFDSHCKLLGSFEKPH